MFALFREDDGKGKSEMSTSKQWVICGLDNGQLLYANPMVDLVAHFVIAVLCFAAQRSVRTMRSLWLHVGGGDQMSGVQSSRISSTSLI